MSGLAAADADCVVAFGDHRFAGFGHHAQIAMFQLEVDLLRRAGLEMDALESAERAERRALHIREAQIELGNFIAAACRCWSP